MHLFRPLAIFALFAAPVAAQTPAPAPTPAAAPAPAPRPAKLDYDSVAFGRQVTIWFYAGQLDSLWAHTDPALRERMGGTKEGWNQPMSQFLERVGSEASLVEERWILRNGARQYVRVFNGTEFTQEPVALRWVLLPGKMIAGSGMNPLSRMPPADPE
jgi:hypothetical protein